jgi:hypothetical protein
VIRYLYFRWLQEGPGGEKAICRVPSGEFCPGLGKLFPSFTLGGDSEPMGGFPGAKLVYAMAKSTLFRQYHFCVMAVTRNRNYS